MTLLYHINAKNAQQKLKTISTSPFAKMQQKTMHGHRCDNDLIHKHNYNYQPFF